MEIAPQPKVNGKELQLGSSPDGRIVQTLVHNQETLGRVVMTNFAAVRSAFSLVDAHESVLRRIVNDMVKNDVRKNGDDIDYDWYAAQYNGFVAVTAFVEWLSSGAKTAADAPETLRDDFVFGGDYANQNNSTR